MRRLELQPLESFPNHEIKTRILLTPYQLAEILLFRRLVKENNQRVFEDFGALGGALNPQEQKILEKLSQRLLEERRPAEVYKGTSFGSAFDGLITLAEIYQEPEAAKILERISQLADCWLITADDLQSVANFRKLPKMVQLAFAQTGRGLFDQIKYFLENGGVMVFIQFKKPAPVYLSAIAESFSNHNSQIGIQEKITLALKPALALKPEGAIEEASHQFLTVNFIPPQPTPSLTEKPGNPAHLALILERKIDEKIEKDYTRLTLLQTIVSQEMKSVFYAMGGLIIATPFLYWLNEQGKDNFLAQTAIKFIPPLLSDLVTFYSQLKPWLEGENFFEELTDLIKRILSSHRKSFFATIVGNIFGSSFSEWLSNYNQLAAATVYSVIPFATTILTTFDTYSHLRKKLTDKTNLQVIKEMLIANPAQVGMNLSAFLTFLTGVGVLGLAGQFHNPTAIALIEGMEENLLTALITKLQLTFGLSLQYTQWAKKEIDQWLREHCSQLA